MSAVHDHIEALLAEASAERLAHLAGHRGASSRGGDFRRRAGRALMALGAFVEGHAEREPSVDRIAAVRP